MNFQPDLAAKVVAGHKTVTRRLASDNPRSPWWRGGCRYTAGKEFTVNPGRGKVNIGRARVVSARLEDLADLDDGEAFREGFATKVEFVDAWAAINGSYDSEARVWRVEFEVTG
jgi:hypothetical protein